MTLINGAGTMYSVQGSVPYGYDHYNLRNDKSKSYYLINKTQRFHL